MNDEEPEQLASISTSSGTTDKGEPVVILNIFEGEVSKQTRISPGQSISMGLMLIASAIDAERDAGMFRFIKEAGGNNEQLSMILDGVRKYRDMTSTPLVP